MIDCISLVQSIYAPQMVYPGIVMNALMLTFGTSASMLIAYQVRGAAERGPGWWGRHVVQGRGDWGVVGMDRLAGYVERCSPGCRAPAAPRNSEALERVCEL